MTFVIVMGFHQIIVVMNDVKRHTIYLIYQKNINFLYISDYCRLAVLFFVKILCLTKHTFVHVGMEFLCPVSLGCHKKPSLHMFQTQKNGSDLNVNYRNSIYIIIITIKL